MLHRIQSRLGPVWFSTLLLFVANRTADFVNAVTGIWLVPKFIPPDQLGAVLPLSQAAGFLALPLYIVLTPYTKLLTLHAEREEAGKTKALLRDAALLSLLAFLVVLLLTPILLPRIFSAFHIENGRLAVAIVLSAVLTSLAPVFTESLRAAKNFQIAALSDILAAPIRFAVMCVALPFRGLTGYFVGQATVPVFKSAIALVAFLKKHWHTSAVPYWKEDRPVFFSYALPLAAFLVLDHTRGFSEMMLMSLIPSTESATYYQMTRFTEMATYIGTTLTFVLFPFFTGNHAKGKNTFALLRQSMVFTGSAGMLVAIALALLGPTLFQIVPFLRSYTVSSSAFFTLTILASVRAVTACFTTHEIACGSFRFLRYYAVLSIGESILAFLLAKGPFSLSTLLDREWRLFDLLSFMLLFAGAILLAVLLDLFRRKPSPSPHCQ